MTIEPTCAERISDDLAITEKHFCDLFTRVDNDEDEARQEINEQAYSISKYSLVKIELSGGGPSSWLEVKLDSDHSVRSVTYFFADWFDVANCKVDKDSSLYRYAIETLEGIYA
jgi:hypothetical protein